MFEQTDLMLNTESVPSNISYKSFTTYVKDIITYVLKQGFLCRQFFLHFPLQRFQIQFRPSKLSLLFRNLKKQQLSFVAKAGDWGKLFPLSLWFPRQEWTHLTVCRYSSINFRHFSSWSLLSLSSPSLLLQIFNKTKEWIFLNARIIYYNRDTL